MTASSPNEQLRLGSIGNRISTIAMTAGVALLVISIAMGFATGWDRFFRSYLMGFMFVVSICLGGLFFVIIQHASRAGWSVVVRRVMEAVAANLTWIWILFLPIGLTVLLGRHDLLYHWLDPSLYVEGDAHYDEILAHKAGYLNKWFWLVRAVVFLGLWALISRFFYRTSVAQDQTGNVALTDRMQWWAPLAAVAYALTQTFAVIDWVMSLEAHWFSTMFGVYFFAASSCGFLAVLIIIVFRLQQTGHVQNEITKEHYQDMGKWLFALGVVFWAYIGFSQYMLIWYANIPEETTWYLARILGGWRTVSWLLLLFHFILPFLFLVTKHTKRIKPVLAGAAVWMLVLHAVDIYWLVMPQVPADALHAAPTIDALVATLEADGDNLGFAPHPVDLTLVLGMFALFVAATARRLGGHALIPVRDPRLHESLAFENF